MEISDPPVQRTPHCMAWRIYGKQKGIKNDNCQYTYKSRFRNLKKFDSLFTVRRSTS